MKQSISWQSVKTLFRLDLRSRYGTNTEMTAKDKGMKAVNVLFALVVYALLVAGIYFLTRMFVVRSGLRIEFLVIITLLTMGIETIVATSTVVKNLYMNGDNELLLRFPVNGAEILIAKSIYCALHNFVVCVLFTLPFYVVFGVVTDAVVGYYFAALGMIIFSTMFPFFVANLIAIPVMRAVNAVKNQFLLILIFVILVICGCFVLYMEALSGILTYLSDNNANLFGDPVIREKLINFAAHAYPFNWYAYVLNGKVAGGLTAKDLGLSFLWIFLIDVVLGVGAYFVTTKFYYGTILKGIETEKVTFQKKNQKNRKRSIFGTLLNREFFLIFRSFNYSFQYFAMACAAPVMVYYCNDIAASMGKKSVGASIVPGLTLLVIIIFVTIVVSFASTSISREGNVFYHTKVIPVSYTNQILVKLFLYALVGTISVALSCIVVGATFGSEKGGNLLSAMDVGAIFGISEMVVLAQTCLSMWADIKSPTFNVSGDGELVSANKNVALALFTGIITAVLYGVFAMVFSFGFTIGDSQFEMTPSVVYGILAGVSGVVLIASVCLLFINLEKRYTKIVP